MAKKLKWNLSLMSVLYLGLGIFLLMRPSTALNVVCYALGGVVAPDVTRTDAEASAVERDEVDESATVEQELSLIHI